MNENYLIKIKVDEKEKVIVNPIIDISTELQKVEKKIIYSTRFHNIYEVSSKKYVFPVVLPEIGVTLSLDIVSKNFAEQFFEETKEIDGIVSKNKIFISNVHNFDQNINRMVSWGNVKSFNLPQEIYQLYLMNLFNDIAMTPSVIMNEKIIAPTRWFYLESSTDFGKFRATLNYNIGIVYLKKEAIEKRKEKIIWVNSQLKLYEVRAGFVTLYPNGYLKYTDHIPIYFESDPLKSNIKITGSGNYFLCSLISFNNYSTSYRNADIKEGHVNKVCSIVELVFSVWDLLPFLFPFMMNPNELYSLIFSFQVPKSLLLIFQKRLSKFGESQSLEIIEAYDHFMRQRNKAMRIIETEEAYLVKVVNPLIVPFLIKKAVAYNKTTANKLLMAKDFLEKIEEINKKFPNKLEWHLPEISPFSGVGSLLDLRKKLMREYLNIFQKYNLNK